jgi:hypothetical protein
VECESSEQAALKLYREAEVLEAYGKRTEAIALYRQVRTLLPECVHNTKAITLIVMFCCRRCACGPALRRPQATKTTRPVDAK